ncbi:MAG: LemA family protein [Clostridia bacterium]
MINKKGNTMLIVIAVIIAIVVLIAIWAVNANNTLVQFEEEIKQNQAEIDNQLKRRADLIPNILSTVKGFAKQEQSIIDSITASREKMTNGNTQDKLNANQQLTRSINLVVESYPEIKSNTAYLQLNDELAGTENRISVANKRYNDGVAKYNKKLKTFPSSIIASMFGHTNANYLQISEADKTLPKIEF